MKIIKAIVLNLMIISIATFLFAPGLIGLNPFSENIVKKTMFGIDGIALLLLTIAGNCILFLGKRKKVYRLPEKIKPEEIEAHLIKMRDTTIFSDLLDTTIAQLEKADKADVKLNSTIADKFQKNSISWNKFYTAVVSAHQSIIQNSILVAERIEKFETEEFIELQRIISMGEYKMDTVPDDIQEEKYQLFLKRWEAIQNLCNINERLLVKLDALDAEISDIGDNEINNENDKILSEIERMIAETHYYE